MDDKIKKIKSQIGNELLKIYYDSNGKFNFHIVVQYGSVQVYELINNEQHSLFHGDVETIMYELNLFMKGYRLGKQYGKDNSQTS